MMISTKNPFSSPKSWLSRLDSTWLTRILSQEVKLTEYTGSRSPWATWLTFYALKEKRIEVLVFEDMDTNFRWAPLPRVKIWFIILGCIAHPWIYCDRKLLSWIWSSLHLYIKVLKFNNLSSYFFFFFAEFNATWVKYWL